MKKRKNNTKLISGVVIFIIAVLAFAGSRLIKDPETLFEDTGLRNSQQSESNMMYVDFIDVGQGNCTLIHMGDTAILVDSGEYTFLCKILQQLNIADCGVTYARFKIFTKLIINNVNSVIPDLT